MRVRTEPEVTPVEEKLSVKDLTPSLWKEALRDLKREGYTPTRVLLRRSARPTFPMRVTLSVKSDWDPEIDDADMVVQLRRS